MYLLVRLTEVVQLCLKSWATLSFSRNTVLHGDGPIVECRANVFTLIQTLAAVKRGLLAVHTFTCCPILVATGPPSPACDMLMEGGLRSECHVVFFLQNKGPRKSMFLYHFTSSS